jgi:hypothetical protein
MSARHWPLASALAVLAGCMAASRQRGPAAAHLGVPVPAIDAFAVADAAAASAETVRLPDRITLPATYRLMLVDGHLSLVREADPQSMQVPPASMRIVTGEIARGELAFQPALLPQELAAEVAANRESAARMDDALDSVMRRSRELSAQALEVQTQSRRLSDLVAAAEARIRELQAQGGSGHAAGTDAPGGPSE